MTKPRIAPFRAQEAKDRMVSTLLIAQRRGVIDTNTAFTLLAIWGKESGLSVNQNKDLLLELSTYIDEENPQ